MKCCYVDSIHKKTCLLFTNKELKFIIQNFERSLCLKRISHKTIKMTSINGWYYHIIIKKIRNDKQLVISVTVC